MYLFNSSVGFKYIHISLNSDMCKCFDLQFLCMKSLMVWKYCQQRPFEATKNNSDLMKKGAYYTKYKSQYKKLTVALCLNYKEILKDKVFEEFMKFNAVPFYSLVYELYRLISFLYIQGLAAFGLHSHGFYIFFTFFSSSIMQDLNGLTIYYKYLLFNTHL